MIIFFKVFKLFWKNLANHHILWFLRCRSEIWYRIVPISAEIKFVVFHFSLFHLSRLVGPTRRSATRIRQWRPWHQEPISPGEHPRTYPWRGKSETPIGGIIAHLHFRRWSQQICVSHLFESVHPPTFAQPAYEVSFGRETILVHILWQRIQRYVRFEATHTNAYRYILVGEYIFKFISLVFRICSHENLY
jgi:hypothetical protein